jgi:hypothetical protein
MVISILKKENNKRNFQLEKMKQKDEGEVIRQKFKRLNKPKEIQERSKKDKMRRKKECKRYNGSGEFLY